ncbi:hypothetical protein AVEN_137624-1 [Araneus ventricosus]|uniref:Uncharacterized protein n=1 Tax=Araneus ventricosus TaxID=182803 RepID=A0A4Y2CTS0_ARAVE|nr:hypothetical protein AVEN_137624-1 [Araneus ventricosus]
MLGTEERQWGKKDPVQCTVRPASAPLPQMRPAAVGRTCAGVGPERTRCRYVEVLALGDSEENGQTALRNRRSSDFERPPHPWRQVMLNISDGCPRRVTIRCMLAFGMTQRETVAVNRRKKSRPCPLSHFSAAVFTSLSEENLVPDKCSFNFGKRLVHREVIRCKRRGMLSDGVILLHDKTYSARKTQELLRKLKREV